jgi:outer membrane murein-binding lipoprotein Lpp
MRVALLIGALGGSLGLATFSGCASPQKIQEDAYRHEMRAAEFQAQGDYVRAAEERREAAKARAKAAERGSYWY